MKQKLVLLLTSVGIFAGLLLLWMAVIHLFHIPSYLLPEPAQVFRAGVSRFPSLMKSLEITGAAAPADCWLALLGAWRLR